MLTLTHAQRLLLLGFTLPLRLEHLLGDELMTVTLSLLRAPLALLLVVKALTGRQRRRMWRASATKTRSPAFFGRFKCIHHININIVNLSWSWLQSYANL